jgi:hypothetical protein
MKEYYDEKKDVIIIEGVTDENGEYTKGFLKEQKEYWLSRYEEEKKESLKEFTWEDFLLGHLIGNMLHRRRNKNKIRELEEIIYKKESMK